LAQNSDPQNQACPQHSHDQDSAFGQAALAQLTSGNGGRQEQPEEGEFQKLHVTIPSRS
jgi:hypothetical protein